MTTVGYGDLYPHTDEGPAIAIMVMLVGIGFVAVLTASIAQRFVGEQVATAEMEIERDEAEVLAELLDLQRRLRHLEGSIQRLGRFALTQPISSLPGPHLPHGGVPCSNAHRAT